MVIGYALLGSAKVLYVGEDGDAAEKVLYAENEDFPRREYIVRPQPVKVRVDPSKEEIEEGEAKLAAEAKALADAEEAARVVLIDPVAAITVERDEIAAERDALAAKVLELEAAKDAPPVDAPPVDAPTEGKKK